MPPGSPATSRTAEPPHPAAARAPPPRRAATLRGFRREPLLPERVTGHLPEMREGAVHHGSRGSIDGTRRVTPGRAVLLRHTRPLVADAVPPRHGGFAVDDEHLAMIADQVVPELEHLGWAEPADLDSGVAELPPETVARREGAEPVGQDLHRHAGLGALDQRVGEPAAGRIAAEDVAVEVNPPLCAGDPLEHRGIDLGTIEQQADAIARNGTATRRPIHRAIYP